MAVLEKKKRNRTPSAASDAYVQLLQGNEDDRAAIDSLGIVNVVSSAKDDV